MYQQRYYTPYQLKLPVDLERKIEIFDSVYTFCEVIDHIDLRKYLTEKDSRLGRKRYDEITLLKVILFAYSKQQELLQASGISITPGTPIFSTPLGLTYEPRTYEDLFKRTLKAAAIPDINFHALRHTFATRALEAGMDIKVLSSILGHAQASTTLNLYAHALPDHKKISMEKMGVFYG